MRRSRLIVLLMLLPVLLIGKLFMSDTRLGPRRLSLSMWSVSILVLRMALAIRWAIRRLGV